MLCNRRLSELTDSLTDNNVLTVQPENLQEWLPRVLVVLLHGKTAHQMSFKQLLASEHLIHEFILNTEQKKTKQKSHTQVELPNFFLTPRKRLYTFTFVFATLKVCEVICNKFTKTDKPGHVLIQETAISDNVMMMDRR